MEQFSSVFPGARTVAGINGETGGIPANTRNRGEEDVQSDGRTIQGRTEL